MLTPPLHLFHAFFLPFFFCLEHNYPSSKISANFTSSMKLYLTSLERIRHSFFGSVISSGYCSEISYLFHIHYSKYATDILFCVNYTPWNTQHKSCRPVMETLYHIFIFFYTCYTYCFTSWPLILMLFWSFQNILDYL